MKNENSTSWPRRWAKRFAKVLLSGALSIVVVAVAAHLIWKVSGSNEWELEIDKNGIKVYSLKAPGSTWKRFKATTRVETTLNRAVAAMLDRDIENCAEWVPGCSSGHSVEPWDVQQQYMIHFYHVDFPPPFAPREFLLKIAISQDPESDAVLVEYKGVPDKLPRNECCVRITEMHNSWQYMPLEDGRIEVTFRQNMEMGGFIPYFLINGNAPGSVYALLSDMPRLLNKRKYLEAEYEFIEEVAMAQ